jgi:hypothetical protein
MRYGAVMLLVSCGWSETKFEVVGIERLCEAASACAGTYDAATCIDLLRSTDRSACSFDPKAARDCSKEAEEAACAEVVPFGVKELTVPESCHQTYDCEWIDLSAF